MSRRIRKLTFPCREFNEIADLSGSASNEALSAYLRGATHVADLSVIEVAKDGDSVKLYVESSTFPVLSCCYKANAPEWTTVTLGEQRG